jgi:hypothetical protein
MRSVGAIPTASPAIAERRPLRADLRALLAIMLSGMYAWGATLAAPALGVAASGLARLAAGLALVPLLLGPVLARRRPRLGRAVGVIGFLGCCALGWALLGAALSRDRLDPLRAGLGTVAWCLYALGWGLYPTERSDDAAPEGPALPSLPPRRRLPASLAVAFAVLGGGALALPLLAFRIEPAAVALFGHALALGGAIALIATGTRVLLLADAEPAPRARLPGSFWLLALWLSLGAAWQLRELGIVFGGPGP